MKVIFADEAIQNLRDIGDYIAQDNPTRARTFVRELHQKAKSIGRTPRAYPLVAEFEEMEVRRRTHGAYLILYTIDAGQVVVLFIVHGARNYEALLASKH